MNTLANRTKEFNPGAQPFNVNRGDTALVFGAHPDDIEVMNSHLIQKLIARGIDVRIVTVTDGEESTKGDRRRVKDQRIRIDEAHAAYTVLGIPEDDEHRHFLHARDGSLHGQNQQRRLSRNFIELIQRYDAKIGITQGVHGYDTNRDHTGVNNAVLQAARRLGDITVAGLNHESNGKFTVKGDSDIRTAAITEHFSQFPTHQTRPEGPEDEYTTWQGLYVTRGTAAELAGYSALELAETYDVLHVARNAAKLAA